MAVVKYRKIGVIILKNQVIRFWAPGGLFMSSGDVFGGFSTISYRLQPVLGFKNGFIKVEMKVVITSHTFLNSFS
jgi:hypothetical protein